MYSLTMILIFNKTILNGELAFSKKLGMGFPRRIASLV